MVEAIDEHSDVADDAEVVGWLDQDATDLHANIIIKTAANAIGNEALHRLADCAEASGALFSAGLRLAAAGLTDAYFSASVTQARLEGKLAKQQALLLRATSLLRAGGDPEDRYQRTVELGLLVVVSAMLGMGHPKLDVVYSRLETLLEPPGVLPATTLRTKGTFGGTYNGLYYRNIGLIRARAGSHLVADQVRAAVRWAIGSTNGDRCAGACC